jgi:hypothetical protein
MSGGLVALVPTIVRIAVLLYAMREGRGDAPDDSARPRLRNADEICYEAANVSMKSSIDGC